MSYYNNNSGYIGQSMSVRAKEAYNNDEMPLSKWTKSEFAYHLEGTKLEHLLKLNVNELRLYCLDLTSWHHTGKFYNQTDFYSLKDLDELESIDVESIIKDREPKARKPKEPKPKPTFITALIKRVYKENRGSMKHPRIYIVTETFTAQFMSNEKKVRNYNLSSNNITVLLKKEQKTKYYDYFKFNELKEVKELIKSNNYEEKQRY